MTLIVDCHHWGRILFGPALVLIVTGLGLTLAQNPVGQITTRDAHALLWLSDGRILFGHHDGIQVSADGGKSWQNLVSRQGWDAMNLAVDGKRLIVAGHDVYAQSGDPKPFRDIKPKGLAGLDLHGYGLDPKNPLLHCTLEAMGNLHLSRDGGQSCSRTSGSAAPVLAVGLNGSLYTAVAGVGLLVSKNQGQGFELLSPPERDIFDLEVASDGILYAAGKAGLRQQTQSGWKRLAPSPLILVAANPKRSTQLGG